MRIKLSTEGKNRCGDAQQELKCPDTNHAVADVSSRAVAMGGISTAPPTDTAAAILGKLHQDPPRDGVSLEIYEPPYSWPTMRELPADARYFGPYNSGPEVRVNLRKYGRDLISAAVASAFVLRNLEELMAVPGENPGPVALKQLEVLGFNEAMLSLQTAELARTLRRLSRELWPALNVRPRVERYFRSEVTAESSLAWLDTQLQAIGQNWVLNEVALAQFRVAIAEAGEATVAQTPDDYLINSFGLATEAIYQLSYLLNRGEFVTFD